MQYKQSKMLKINVQETPNPQALKFVFNDKLTENAFEFENAGSAQYVSPLSAQLLNFPWVKRVFIRENFISITKEDWIEWEPVKGPLLQMLEKASKEDILPSRAEKPRPTNSENSNQSSDEVVKKIKHILSAEIQPAVQRDGGFIQFDQYKDGRVYVKLQGACSGCPSAEWTLKQGIEERLKRDLPQILEVISIPC